LVIPWQEDAATLRELYHHERAGAIRPRLHALWLLRDEQPLRQVAALLDVHHVTVQDWVAWYRQGGVAEVRRHKLGGGQGRACFLDAAQPQQPEEQAKTGTFRTAGDVQAWIAQPFAVDYSRGGIYNLLARLRWKPKVTRPQATTTSAETQEQWKKGPPNGASSRGSDASEHQAVREVGVVVVEQPAGSPELNPAEWVCAELRRRIEGQLYETIDEKVATVERELQTLATDPNRARRLAGWSWITGTC
jgi:transposase